MWLQAFDGGIDLHSLQKCSIPFVSYLESRANPGGTTQANSFCSMGQETNVGLRTVAEQVKLCILEMGK